MSDKSAGNAPDRKDLIKDIFLFVSIGFCVLLFLSSFGICGKFGNVLAGFFFGLFGVIAYAFPILLLAGTFFVAVFYKVFYKDRKPAIIKMVYIFLFYIFFATFIEIAVNGNSSIGPVNAYNQGFDNKSGGGFFGGIFASLFCGGFGEVGAFIIDVVILIVLLILHAKRGTFASIFDKLGNSSKNAVDKNRDNKRRANNRKEVQRIKRQRDEARNITAATNRFDHKVSGVDLSNTSLRNSEATPDVTKNNNVNVADVDGMNEISINMYDEATDKNIEPSDITRVPLKSDAKSTSKIHFGESGNVTSRSTVPTSLEVQESDSSSYEQDTIHKSESDIDPIASTINSTPETVETVNSPINSTPEPIPATIPESEPELVKPAPLTQTKASTSNQSDNNTSLMDELNQTTKTSSSKAKKNGSYKYPPLNLLDPAKAGSKDSKQYIMEQAQKLIHVLDIFGVKAELGDITHGPTVTRYEIVPEMGTKVSKIVNLADDIKLNLAAKDIRIQAPIPGKSSVGIEIPNEKNSAVMFGDLMRDKAFRDTSSKVAFAAGKDIEGQIVIADIAKMPHMLIAGSTGSGKSVCINTIIMSILYKASPDEVKFIMVDPKVVELSNYNGIPHLLIPVVTDPKKASMALNWAVTEMMNRYKKFEHARVRNIAGYNEKILAGEITVPSPDGGEVVVNEKMYQMVIIIDELADLMMVAAKEVENSIARLAQLARAAGIHLIVATQRPSADIVTGLIKTNIPSRISFAVSSAIDSRVILDETGAERLLGKGDMLYFPQGATGPTRVQGAWVSDDEIHRVTEYVINNNNYDDSTADEITEQINQSSGGSSISGTGDGEDGDDRDQYFEQCGRLIIEKEKGSIGMLQRNFKIGFNRAARIMDQLEDMGVVGPEEGTKPRRVLITLAEFEEMVK